MARPKGSTNKPKVVKITKVEADLANKLGITTEQFAKEKLKLNRTPRKPRVAKVDWEKLAKQLQQALAAEIKENDSLKEELDVARGALHLATAKNAVLIKQIEFLQNMTAKVLANTNGNN
jgi:folylpolyglutamate synthase/dihydropteroate synthase